MTIHLLGLYKNGEVPDSFGVMPIHDQGGALRLEQGETELKTFIAASAFAESVPSATASEGRFTRLWSVRGPLTVTVTNLRTTYYPGDWLTIEMSPGETLDGAARFSRKLFKRGSDYVASGQVRHQWAFRVDGGRRNDEGFMSLLTLYPGADSHFIRVQFIFSQGDDAAQFLVKAAAAHRLALISKTSGVEREKVSTLAVQVNSPTRSPGLWGADYLLPYGYAIGHSDLPYTLRAKRDQG